MFATRIYNLPNKELAILTSQSYPDSFLSSQLELSSDNQISLKKATVRLRVGEINVSLFLSHLYSALL